MPDPQKPVDAGISTTLSSSGCLVMVGWAGLSCVLLFVNGGIVMALVHALQERGVDWLREPRLVQFLVIVGPVALLVLQWSMIDQLRSYVGRRW